MVRQALKDGWSCKQGKQYACKVQNKPGSNTCNSNAGRFSCAIQRAYRRLQHVHEGDEAYEDKVDIIFNDLLEDGVHGFPKPVPRTKRQRPKKTEGGRRPRTGKTPRKGRRSVATTTEDEDEDEYKTPRKGRQSVATTTEDEDDDEYLI